eukprot:3940236-Rhodomonas_salina.5
MSGTEIGYAATRRNDISRVQRCYGRMGLPVRTVLTDYAPIVLTDYAPKVLTDYAPTRYPVLILVCSYTLRGTNRWYAATSSHGTTFTLILPRRPEDHARRLISGVVGPYHRLIL